MTAKMENKTALLILVAVAILAAIFLFYSLEQQANKPSASVADQVAAAVAAGNLSGCNAFANASTSDGISYETICRNNVALALANKDLDPSYCADLDGTLASSTQCETTVLTLKAAQTGNVAVCAGASTAAIQSSCTDAYWAGQALQANNASMCAKLDSTSTQAGCQDSLLIAQLQKNPKTFSCGQFSSPDLASNCAAYEEVAQGNVAACTFITDARFRAVCLGK
jgi:hypothetical protein